MLFDHSVVWEEKERERGIGADLRLALRVTPRLCRDISSLTEMVRRVAFPLWYWRSARRSAMSLLLGLRKSYPSIL